MIAGEILALVFGVAVVAYVLAPLFRQDAAEAERVGAAVSELRDLASKREMLLSALRDLEDDHASGKIDEEDYREMHDRLSAEAVEIMKQLDAVDEAQRSATPVGMPPAAQR